MSNVGYDLDTSGGLMPLIRALIRPPDEEINVPKPKRTQHPYYKRPGKGHNHDSCDSCQEGGDLICCDRCPASFHLGCHDPPLEENDIPLGQWLCHECRISTGVLSLSGAGTSTSQIQVPSKSRQGSPTPSDCSEKKTRSRTQRSNSNQSSSSRKNEKDSKEQKSGKDDSRDKISKTREPSMEDQEDEKQLSPMEILVKAARIMNPKQFEVPFEMRIPCPFPGTDKAEPTNGNGKKNGNSEPSASRLCFTCGISCRVAPLLQCDYCPLLFHQDCLDPPLTALPSGRWMCPNHVEQYIDWKLVNSASATERVALWERFSGPVDQQAIKLDFIRHARKDRPLFRVRVPVSQRGCVIVPAMVRHHYTHPPPLQPNRREYVRCRNITKSKPYEIPDDSEEEITRKHIICMNLACPKYLTKNGVCRHETEFQEEVENGDAHGDLHDNEDNETEEDKGIKRGIQEIIDGEEDLDEIQDGLKKRKRSDSKCTENGDLSTTDSCDFTLRFDADDLKPEKNDADDIKSESIETDVNLSHGDTNQAKSVLQTVEQQLKRLDERLIKLLAFQRLQQILEGKANPPPPRHHLIGNDIPLDSNVANLITRSINKASLTKYGFKHIALPSELLSKADIENITRNVTGDPLEACQFPEVDRDDLERLKESPGAPEGADEGPSSPGHSLSNTTVKATLCPIERPARNGLGDGLGRPVPMRLSRLSIGAGSGCDISLTQYGRCNYISNMHAVIFFDEVTHHFELMNYSEFGSCVNGQLYSCDFTRGPEVRSEGAGVEERAAAVRDIARRRRDGPNTSDDTSDRLSAPTVPGHVQKCQCNPPSSNTLVCGWEGSAVLTHGAVLHFGCIMFVFSITDAQLLIQAEL